MRSFARLWPPATRLLRLLWIRLFSSPQKPFLKGTASLTYTEPMAYVRLLSKENPTIISPSLSRGLLRKTKYTCPCLWVLPGSRYRGKSTYLWSSKGSLIRPRQKEKKRKNRNPSSKSASWSATVRDRRTLSCPKVLLRPKESPSRRETRLNRE